ncbi:MAG TPA: radical SAM protein [Phycisphaerales bacterium]|nr:radical SAM protein [Phycisphaerales bacterium]
MPTIYQPPAESPQIDALDPGLLAAVVRGESRLTPEQGLDLLVRAPLHTLGRYADARCRELHGDHIRTYVIDRNINYTNVCTARCTFCAFRRDATDHDAYTLEKEQLFEKVAALEAIGGTQILLQGGMNPDLPFDWYLDLLAGLKERFPEIHVHGFSPPEFVEFVNFFDPPGSTLEDKLRWVMVRLQEAGLDSLPGAGGEIFAPAVRTKIGLGKCTAEAWLTTMYVAHSLGMFTSATMMFGHIEGVADRIHHMRLVREWQDKALLDFGASNPLEIDFLSEKSPDRQGGVPGTGEPGEDRSLTAAARSEHYADLESKYPARLRSRRHTGGHYVSFISWPFQPDNTPLGRLKEWPQPGDEGAFPGDAVGAVDGAGTKDMHPEFGRRLRLAGSTAYLRTQAVSRLMLDNIYSIGSSWVTMGPHIGQLALHYGANDMGSVMMEENVVSAAGTTYCLDEAVLNHLIRAAGYIPAQRDNVYDILKLNSGPDSPDLRVRDWSEHRASKLAYHLDEGNRADLTVGASDR